MLRKISSLILISLIFNLNMVVPAVSYASSDETCSCHLSSQDRQCHCNNHHDHESGIKENKSEETKGVLTLKAVTCSPLVPSDSAVPALSIPFLVPDFGHSTPLAQVSSLPNLVETILKGVTITPSEKPPTV